MHLYNRVYPQASFWKFCKKSWNWLLLFYFIYLFINLKWWDPFSITLKTSIKLKNSSFLPLLFSQTQKHLHWPTRYNIMCCKMLRDCKLYLSLNNKKCTLINYSRKLIDKDVFNNAVLSKLIRIESAFKSIF